MTGPEGPPPRDGPSSTSHGLPATLGAEIEMPVIDATGRSACVTDGYFTALAQARAAAGETVTTRRATGPDGAARLVGVSGGWVENGLDNGFNLLESAFAPVATGAGGLRLMAERMRDDLARVQAALAPQGLAVTALSQHPTAGTGPDWYARAVAPRPIYSYLRERRGWNHAAGIDAKAQNGPTTGTTVAQAIPALNLLLAAAPAFIALFAGSPWEDGRSTGLHETRMTLWPRMVAPSRVASDRDRTGLPPRWFGSLSDYFLWTFGAGSVMHALPDADAGYKAAPGFVVVEDAADALDFLSGPPRHARRVDTGARVTVTPAAHHLEALQWSNFLDIRLRFAFGPDAPPAAALARALRDPAACDRMLAAHLTNLYLENRCAGATLPDADLAARADDAVGASCMVAPLALQAGLAAAAPEQAGAFLARWPIGTIRHLRAEAIRHGLSPTGDPQLRRFCDAVLALAADNLPAADRPALAYADWVARTGMTTAARALDQAARMGGDLHAVAAARRAVPPPPL